MTFKYELQFHGWAIGFIEVNNQKCEFTVSHLDRNALGYLLEAITNIIRVNSGEVIAIINEKTGEGIKEFTFTWDEEGTLKKWKLKALNNNMMEIKIENSDECYENINTEINTTCNVIDLLKKIISALDLLLIKHGLVGYFEMWGYEFPLGLYIKLKHYLETGKFYSAIKLYDDNNREYKKSDIIEDITFISKVIK